jgi:hypothetical protein
MSTLNGNSINWRAVVVSAATSVLATAAVYGQGGDVAITTAPSAVSGLTPGLVATVWHNGSAQLPAAPDPTMADVNNMESFIATGSANYGGFTYALPAASYSFLNTADTFNYPGNQTVAAPGNGGYAATYYYLGQDASGAATQDGNPWAWSIVDQLGYVKIPQAGVYTFNVSAADDAGNVMVGGAFNQANTGTDVVAAGWDSTNIPTSNGVANVTFSSAGYYPIEVMNYQEASSANMQFSVSGPAGAGNVGYYTTAAAAAAVTPFNPSPPVLSASPAPLHEWNFSSANVSGSVVQDIGAAGSSATAGTVTGGATVAHGQLVTANTALQGMTIPYAALSNISGSFSIEDVFTRNSSDSGWSTLFSLGQSTSEYILSHPQRQDNQTLTGEISNGSLQSGGSGPMELNWKGGAAVAGQQMVETMVFDSTDDMISYYVNGVLQGTGLVSGGFDLSQVAGTTAQSNGIGGFDAFGDPAFAGTTRDFRIYGSALTAGQVLSDYQLFDPIPDPATSWIFGFGIMALCLMRKANRGKCAVRAYRRSPQSSEVFRGV